MCHPQAIILDSKNTDKKNILEGIKQLRNHRDKSQLFLVSIVNKQDKSFISELYQAGVSDIISYDEMDTSLHFRLHQGLDMILTYSKLLKANRRQQMAQDLANIGSWEWMPNEKAMSWSYTTYQLLGVSPNLMPPTLDTLINSLIDEDRHKTKEQMLHAFHSAKPLEIECKLNQPAGLQRIIKIVAEPYFEAENFISFDGYICDITDEKRSESQLIELAFKDSLTGLDNRRLLSDKINLAIKISKRQNQQFSILFLDLDGFKQINDSFGHEHGDQLLIKVALRLKELVRAGDCVARLGGDEFCILLNENTDEFSAVHVAQKIIDSFKHPFDLGRASILIGVSIGISLYPIDGATLQTLFKSADTAMYNAKDNGKNQFSHYSEELTKKAIERLDLEQALKIAFKNKEFELYFQPKASLNDRNIIGVEALIRWNRPGYGYVSPEIFIPISESIGLIGDIGTWVLDTACLQLAKWHNSGIKISMAVNISPLQFEYASFTENLLEILEKAGLTTEYLELEITESGVQVSDTVIKKLRSLRALGIKIAIDDFGTGYSTLSSLKNLPVDILKIDKEFISNIPQNSNDSAMVATIIGMAKTLDLEIVAEGVETLEQIEYLCAIGCDIAQGYFIGKPLPVIDFEDQIKNNFLPTDVSIYTPSQSNVKFLNDD